MGRARVRPKTRKETREANVWLVLFIGLVFLYQEVLDWSGWAMLLSVVLALASTAFLMFAAGFTRDTWPATHPGLAGTQVRLIAAGYRKDGYHRWWDCTEKRPHVHMSREGHGSLVLIWNGTTVLDAAGNVVSHEQ